MPPWWNRQIHLIHLTSHTNHPSQLLVLSTERKTVINYSSFGSWKQWNEEGSIPSRKSCVVVCIKTLVYDCFYFGRFFYFLHWKCLHCGSSQISKMKMFITYQLFLIISFKSASVSVFPALKFSFNSACCRSSYCLQRVLVLHDELSGFGSAVMGMVDDSAFL